MKSKIVTKIPKIVLTYGVVGDTLNALLEVAKSNNVIVRQVMPSELDVKISQLLKVKQLNLEQYPPDCDTCILMANFDNSSIDAFLKDIKSNHIDITLKAMLTPTNRIWTFNRLLENLRLEHEKFMNR
ncbi:MAG: DUF3783 domain-containing protein [Ruminococcus sp.]|nr:DUF3783 domain-containing protein [Ruminococcus sp.]